MDENQPNNEHIEEDENIKKRKFSELENQSELTKSSMSRESSNTQDFNE